MESHIKSASLFADVAALVYVIDVEHVGSESELLYMESTIDSLRQMSLDAPVFVLLHKTDLLVARHETLKERELEIRKRALPTLVHVYATSIWDESLYKVPRPLYMPLYRRGRASCTC